MHAHVGMFNCWRVAPATDAKIFDLLRHILGTRASGARAKRNVLLMPDVVQWPQHSHRGHRTATLLAKWLCSCWSQDSHGGGRVATLLTEWLLQCWRGTAGQRVATVLAEWPRWPLGGHGGVTVATVITRRSQGHIPDGATVLAEWLQQCWSGTAGQRVATGVTV